MKKFLLISKKTLILLLPVIAYLLAALSVKSHTNFCLIKFFFGHECWGCGLTRAFVALCHLDFKTAYEYNHLIIIVIPLLLLLWILIIKKEFYNKDEKCHSEPDSESI